MVASPSARAARRADPPDAPLRRLQWATRVYAQAGQLGYGLGMLPMSVATLGAGLVAWHRPSLAAVALGAAAPPLGVLGAAAARRWYQGLGRVTPAAEEHVTPPTGADVVAAFGRGLMWLWILTAGALLGAGPFLAESTHLLRTAALSFGSALLTRALLRRAGPGRGEVFPMILAVVGLRLLDPATWGVLGGYRSWAISMLALGALLAVFALVHHGLFLRARRGLAEARAG